MPAVLLTGLRRHTPLPSGAGGASMSNNSKKLPDDEALQRRDSEGGAAENRPEQVPKATRRPRASTARLKQEHAGPLSGKRLKLHIRANSNPISLSRANGVP
jgi:hypothetical protein